MGDDTFHSPVRVNHLTQVLLFGPAPFLTGDQRARLENALRKSSDPREMLRMAARHRLSSALFYNLDRLGLLETLPKQEQRLLSQIGRIAQHISDLQTREAGSIVEELSKTKTRFRLLKGIHFAWAVYPDPRLREYRDIDILLPGDRMDHVEQFLTASGYVRGTIKPGSAKPWGMSDEEVAAYENSSGEKAPYVKLVRATELAGLREACQSVPELPVSFAGGKPFLYAKVDLHWSLTRHGWEMRQIWSDADEFEFCGNKALGLRAEDLVWYLALKVYNETMWHNLPSFRYLHDLAVLAQRRDLNWGFVSRTCRRRGIAAELFYALKCVQVLRPERVPDWLLMSLSKRIPSEGLGNLTPKLFGNPVLAKVLA